jgi:Fibronectin type III domain
MSGAWRARWCSVGRGNRRGGDMRAGQVVALVATVVCVGLAGSQLDALPAEAAVAVTPPGAPTGVTAAAINAGAQLRWNAPASTGGAPITGYVITASPGGKTAKTTNVTSFTVGGLTNGTSYTFTVAAVNKVGTGPKSNPSAAVVPRAPVAPSAPRAVTATAGYQSATVAWKPPASNGGAPVSRYTVTANPGAITVTATGDARQAVLGGLANGTAYTVSVTAANSAGTSPATAASAVTPAVTVPAQPSTVQAAADGGGGGMTVRWDPPASDGGSPLTGYTITTSPGGTAQSVSAGTTSLTVSGLTSGTAYTFSVAAVNAQGIGSARASAPATPDATATAAAVVLDAASLSALTDVHTDGSLTFTNAPPQVTGLASGDVIAAGITAATPQGLLRTVTSVTSTGSTTTVATAPAALDQALASGDLAMGGTLGAAQVTGFTAARAGVRLVRPAASPGAGASAGLTVSINADLYKATDSRTVHASGTVTITPAISLSVRLSGGHIYTTYRATLTQASSLKLNAQLTHDFSTSIPLGTATFSPIVFNIGPVPVVIIPTLSLSLAAGGTITVGALTSASETDTYGVQLAGTDGSITATPIKTHTTTYTPPTLYDSLSVHIGPQANLSLLLYGTVGPYVKDSLSLLKLDASTTANPWWTLNAENVVSAGFKLSALGHDISDWKKDPLFDTVVPLANAGGPFMGVVISPHPAAVSPGHTLQLSAVVQRSPIQAVTWSAAKGGGTITSSGLYTAPATPGMYRVTATSPANGLKPLTQGILDIRVGAQPPGAPSGATAASTGTGQATVTWTPPADTGGSAITGYKVTSLPAGGTATTSGTATSTAVNGLTTGATYSFTVTAINASGPGPASAPTAPVVIADIDPYTRSAWPTDIGGPDGGWANPGESMLTSATASAIHPTWTSPKLPGRAQGYEWPRTPIVRDGLAYIPVGSTLTVFDVRNGTIAYTVPLPFDSTWSYINIPGDGRAYLISDYGDATHYKALVAVDLASRTVAWTVFDTRCRGMDGATVVGNVIVVSGFSTCGIDKTTGAILWNWPVPSPDMTFGGVTDGNLVYMTKQVAGGGGQDFWLLGVNPADGSIRINRFFNAPGGFGMMVAGNRLLVPTIDVPTVGNPTPEVLGLDLSTGATIWAHMGLAADGPITTDGNTIWIYECGRIVKLDAQTGALLESVTAFSGCGGTLELAGDLVWLVGINTNVAVAVRSNDLTNAASVPLAPIPYGDETSMPVIADGHLLLVHQYGNTQWQLQSWGP